MKVPIIIQVEDLEEGQHIEDADVEACCRDPSELQDIVNHCKTSVEEQYRGCELLLEVDSADGKLPLHLPEGFLLVWIALNIDNIKQCFFKILL